MLELKNVTYKNKNKLILDNINLKISDNKTIVITGPNGSGKSSLANIIMGINKPTKGKIIFNGEDITNYGIDKRANLGISYAFQNPIIFKGLTVKDLFDSISKIDTSFEEIKKYLSLVGLCAQDYYERDFDETLSGGERKRIEIALTLFKSGNLNIYDEPEAGIDLWSFDKLVNIFKQKLDNTTNLIISHQEKILNIADEIIILENGKVNKHDTKENIIDKINIRPCIKCRGEKNE